ncbi:MAG: tRNA (adenosine(37)-N6)-dimethylallyltransferase MiaA [Hyphomicrobiaceae bacterium]
MNTHRVILIAGPTASGKSALALALAEGLGGVVINADSAQVYGDLRILTARPTPEDEARVPHRLYGHVGGSEAYSAARFIDEAAREIAAARGAGRVPIVVGGTGLYFRALLHGLSPVPPIPDEIRQRRRKEAQVLGPETLHAELRSRDPDTAAGLRPSDPQRLARALEVLDATGRGLASWQREPGQPVLGEGEYLGLVAALSRDEVMARADRRFDAMIGAGAVEEARSLASRRLSRDLPVMRALGVRPLLEVVEGTLALDAAAERAKLDTRHYVKRQLTWLRRHMISWNMLSLQEMERIMQKDFALIYR